MQFTDKRTGDHRNLLGILALVSLFVYYKIDTKIVITSYAFDFMHFLCYIAF